MRELTLPQHQVLILVVMDDALVPQPSLPHAKKQGRVLILVVMDDALVPIKQFFEKFNLNSLNPCCNG